MDKVTMYKTTDGKLFEKEKEASLHEKEIKIIEEQKNILKNYEIEDLANIFTIPIFLHLDTPRLLDRGYKWYIVKEKKDIDIIYDALYAIHKNSFLLHNRKKINDFPTAIGYDHDRHSLFWVEDIEDIAQQSRAFVTVLREAIKKKSEELSDDVSE